MAELVERGRGDGEGEGEQHQAGGVEELAGAGADTPHADHPRHHRHEADHDGQDHPRPEQEGEGGGEAVRPLLAGDLHAQAQGEQGIGLLHLRVAPVLVLDQPRRAQLLRHQVAHVVGAHRPVETLPEGGSDLGRVTLAVDLLEGGVEQRGQLDRLAVGPADEARGLLVARCLVLADELHPGRQLGDDSLVGRRLPPWTLAYPRHPGDASGVVQLLRHRSVPEWRVTA